MGENKSKSVPVSVGVAEFIADHDGVITAGQASRLGMSNEEIKHKVLVRLWIPHARGVYLSAEHRMTDQARVRIAVAAHGGVIDRTSAAWLHGLIPQLPDVITVSVPRSAHGAANCAIETAAKRRSFAAEDITVVNGIAVTALPLTVLLAANVLGVDDAIAMMDRVLQLRRVSVRELRAAADRNSGMHGLRVARALLRAAEDESESEAERMFVRLLRQYGIIGWSQQHWIGSHRLDFVFEQFGIGISIHGWAFHHSRDRWENDQKLTNMLVGIGWIPLVFIWQRLKFEPETVIREVVAAIELRQSAA